MANLDPNSAYFDPDAYINSLMGSVGFDTAPKDQQDQMYRELMEQINHIIMDTATLYVTPDQMDETLINYGNLTDPGEFVRKMVEISPEAQLAIMDALDKFYLEMMEAYSAFSEMK